MSKRNIAIGLAIAVLFISVFIPPIYSEYRLISAISDIIREDASLMLGMVHYDGRSTLSELEDFVHGITSFHEDATNRLKNLYSNRSHPLRDQVVRFLIAENQLVISYYRYVVNLATHVDSLNYALDKFEEYRLFNGSFLVAMRAYEESLEDCLDFLMSTDDCLSALDAAVKAESKIIQDLHVRGILREPIIYQNSDALAKIIEETRETALVLSLEWESQW
jgi:hypothetical protein